MMMWIAIGLALILLAIGVLKRVYRIGKTLIVIASVIFLASFLLSKTEIGQDFGRGVRDGFHAITNR